MSTRDELLDGADFEGYEALCDDIVNMFKNHWRQSDPRTALTDAQPGMIASDEDDEKLWHKLGIGGPVSGACLVSGSPIWDEILQANMSCDTIPLFNSVDLGDNAIMTDSRAYCYLDADQLNVNDTTWTKVLVNHMLYDSGGNLNLASNKFVTRVAGLYLLIGQVKWEGATVVADSAWYTGIYIGGALAVATPLHSSKVDTLSPLTVGAKFIAAGVDVELYCYHNAGVNTPDIDGGADWKTFLAVHLLSI